MVMALCHHHLLHHVSIAVVHHLLHHVSIIVIQCIVEVVVAKIKYKRLSVGLERAFRIIAVQKLAI